MLSNLPGPPYLEISIMLQTLFLPTANEIAANSECTAPPFLVRKAFRANFVGLSVTTSAIFGAKLTHAPPVDRERYINGG